MKWLVQIGKYLVLVTFIFGGFYAISLIPSSSAQKSGNGENDSPQAPLKRIQVSEIVPEPFQETVLLPGTVEPYADVDLGAGIPGIMETVYVKEGDRVKKGQELFQIDLRSRQARLEDARAAYDLAQKNLERKKAVRQRGDITIQELDEAVAQEQQAAAAQRNMEVEVSLGHIYAPIDGIIDTIDADVGEYMHEGTQLARLLEMDRVKVVVGIPERYADSAAHEKKAMVHLEALNEQRPAIIERVAFEAHQQTNTFEATLVMDNQDHRIRPGMIIRAEIVTKRTENAILVPLYALVKRENGMVVFVEKDGVVQSRPVTMGAFQRDRIEILQGLQPEEHVVLIGQQDLVDDQHVEVMEMLKEKNLPGIEGSIQ